MRSSRAVILGATILAGLVVVSGLSSPFTASVPKAGHTRAEDYTLARTGVGETGLKAEPSFSSPPQNVTITESGLAPGTFWAVTLSNYPGFGPPNASTKYSTTSTIEFSEPLGYYLCTPGLVLGYLPGPCGNQNQIAVGNQPVFIGLNFLGPGLYLFTISEVGLGSSASWWASANGTTEGPILVQFGEVTAEFAETNGTVHFSIPAVQGYLASPSSGNVTIDGGPVNLTVYFEAIPYDVTFQETGLPVGADWSVTLNNVPSNYWNNGPLYSSTTSVISFPGFEGNYSFSIQLSDGYGPNPSNGTLSIQGGVVTIDVTFVPVTLVVFSAENLPAYPTWYVSLTGGTPSVILAHVPAENNLTRWSNGNPTIRFYLSIGTYSYVASAFGNGSSTGFVNVSNQTPIVVQLNFPHGTAPASSSSGPSVFDWVLFGGVIAVLAISSAVVIALINRRGKDPPAPVSSPPPRT
jgi:hypothetical protein